jgi:hypothetical protein
MSQTRGWFRVQVVASGLWFLICSGYLVYNRHDLISQTIDAIYSSQNDGEWQVEGQADAFFDCSLTKRPASLLTITSIGDNLSCKPAITSVTWLYAIPLILLWVAIPLGAIIFRWVRAGFRERI